MPILASGCAIERRWVAQRRGPRARWCASTSAPFAVVITASRPRLPWRGQRKCRPATCARYALRNLARDPSGAVFFAAREKTGTPVGGTLSNRALAALEAYMSRLGIELHGEAYIFRNRSGSPYSSDTLGDDFRDVRTSEFGANERRTLADFRRSGAVEAIAGGARAEELAHAMGNTLSASNALYATYVPVNLATIRSVMDARRRGRSRMRENG
jgi:hypothetical protein